MGAGWVPLGFWMGVRTRPAVFLLPARWQRLPVLLTLWPAAAASLFPRPEAEVGGVITFCRRSRVVAGRWRRPWCDRWDLALGSAVSTARPSPCPGTPSALPASGRAAGSPEGFPGARCLSRVSGTRSSLCAPGRQARSPPGALSCAPAPSVLSKQSPPGACQPGGLWFIRGSPDTLPRACGLPSFP